MIQFVTQMALLLHILLYFQFQGGQDHPTGSLSSQLIQRTCDFRSFSIITRALSLVKILFTFALMAAYTRLQARVARPPELRPRQVTQRRLRRGREWVVVALDVGLMLALLIAPLSALVERSLTLSTARGVSLAFYQRLFENPRGSAFYVPPVAAVRNSVGFALATVGLSVALGPMAAAVMDDRGAARGPRPRGQWLRRLLDPVFMLPLGTSAVTLGLGYIVALPFTGKSRYFQNRTLAVWWFLG